MAAWQAHCIDVQSQILVSTLRGHRFPARCASFQKSGKLALTASQDAVILWDTKDWSRYRVLNAGPGVQQVCPPTLHLSRHTGRASHSGLACIARQALSRAATSWPCASKMTPS
jgi:WD40 repeat protein